MEIKSEILLRVNGMTISEAALRHPAQDGHIYPDKYEIEIADPIIGKFALTDDCKIEIKVKERAKIWHTISLDKLILILSPK
jgi:hypothetical protein